MAGKRKGVHHSHRGEEKRRRQPQKGQIYGPGILLTTIRRKERKAGLELIEFLDDLVVDLYPDLDFSLPQREEETAIADKQAFDSDDEYDALRNGPRTITPEANPSSSSKMVQAEVILKNEVPAVKEDDVEAQIQAELNALRPQRRMRKAERKSNGDSQKQIKQTKSFRKKFSLVDPEVECLMFVSVAWPMNPVDLCCALLERVSKTGQVRGHFIQRLSPIYLTCRAEEDKVSEIAGTIMKQHFPNSIEPKTYKVETRIRLHNQLQKMDVIKQVAGAVPAPHRANLTNPDFLINVEIFKMTMGIGILPDYEKYKRYNPQMIAQKYNEVNHNDDAHGATSRALLSSSQKSTLPASKSVTTA